VSRDLDAVVPGAVAAVLDADPIPDDGLTILVLTQRDGWPHVTMISRGEIVSAGPAGLRLALWRHSSIVAALQRDGRASLSLVVGGVAYLLRVRATRNGDVTTPLGGTLARFDCTVEGASADEAPYATIASGVTFRLHDRDAVHARWAQVRAALTEAP
jgi:hypothetical protein